jgi:hypothetical protein
MVLGQFPDYIKHGDDLGAERFNIPTSLGNRMSPPEQWASNQKVLDEAIVRGDDIFRSTGLTDQETADLARTGATLGATHMLPTGERECSCDPQGLIQWSLAHQFTPMIEDLPDGTCGARLEARAV